MHTIDAFSSEFCATSVTTSCPSSRLEWYVLPKTTQLSSRKLNVLLMRLKLDGKRTKNLGLTHEVVTYGKIPWPSHFYMPTNTRLYPGHNLTYRTVTRFRCSSGLVLKPWASQIETAYLIICSTPWLQKASAQAAWEVWLPCSPTISASPGAITLTPDKVARFHVAN